MTDPNKAHLDVLNAIYPALASVTDEGTYVESVQSNGQDWPHIYQIFRHNGVKLCVEVRVTVIGERDHKQIGSHIDGPMQSNKECHPKMHEGLTGAGNYQARGITNEPKP